MPRTPGIQLPAALSPGWGAALSPGPVAATTITEAYARLVAKDAYFWAWPLVNILNRRQKQSHVTAHVMAGPLPLAPLNTLGMLTDYISPEERQVACPNQDVVYGNGFAALDQTPVVVQVPDFGDGFWSLTLYNEHHFFAPNALNRYSLGTKNSTLRTDDDGSLTIHVQSDPPGGDRDGNWLPAPAGADFTLYIRAYWPKVPVLDGGWTPPPVLRVE